MSGGSTYVFTLTGLIPGNAATRAGSIAISGTGFVQINAGPQLFGTWGITGSGLAYNYGSNFSFVTTTVVVPPVPDGGTTLLLLGTALSGLGLARRFFWR
jgi:hypothetical protein